MSVLGHGIGVYEELSAFENLRLFGRLYGLENPSQVAIEWLERTGLGRVRDGLVREFSRGMRQRLAVARAFLHNPSLLILDEPFTALDDRAIKMLQDLLRAALADGRTVIMSTHQLREALELATDVALINRGKLAFRGPRTQECWKIQPGCIVITERHELPPSRDGRRRQGSALGDSQQRVDQCLGRVRARDSASVQFRVRSDVRSGARDRRRPIVAGVRLRRHADPEPQLRARAGESTVWTRCWLRP